MKTRNEELCQNRCRLSCASLLCAAVKAPECNLCDFYSKPLAGIQVFTDQALSCLILSRVFVACLSGEWKAFLCVLLLQAGPVHFQLGHCWSACLLLLFIHLFISGVGAATEPIGCTLCKWKQPLQPLSPPSPPCQEPRGEGKMTYVQPFWKEGYFKGLEACVRLELVCSLDKLGLQWVFDSGCAFLSSSLPACQPFTKARTMRRSKTSWLFSSVPLRARMDSIGAVEKPQL